MRLVSFFVLTAALVGAAQAAALPVSDASPGRLFALERRAQCIEYECNNDGGGFDCLNEGCGPCVRSVCTNAVPTWSSTSSSTKNSYPTRYGSNPTQNGKATTKNPTRYGTTIY